MGIADLLPHLPGGAADEYLHSFYSLALKETKVPFDFASAAWQCAAKHANDYLRGNYLPSLIEVTHLLNYLRSICRWDMIVYLDGRENAAKQPEIERRNARAEYAEQHRNLLGQIRNTPEYIARIIEVCKFFGIKVVTSSYEADPQVSYKAMTDDLIPVTADSDLLAYGLGRQGKVIIVKGFFHEWYREIDLNADVEEGEYPLVDLFHQHGTIVFQLYAACLGCDFTTVKSGIAGVGYKTFIRLTDKMREDKVGELSATTLAACIWSEERAVAENNGFQSAADIARYLQSIVDVYAEGKVYDGESNVVNMNTGEITAPATEESRQHMAGKLDSRTRQPHPESLQKELQKMDCSQLLHHSVAEASTIRGVHLPEGKEAKDCTMPVLRDFIAARGGKITGLKEDLVRIVEQYQFTEKQVPKAYVDRNPNPNGILYAKIDTSVTRPVGDILRDLNNNAGKMEDDDIGDLVRLTYTMYQEGLFDDKYDNIARVAPELKESLIYRMFGHIGSSLTEKNIGDALKRCWYDVNTSYHAIGFVPGKKRVIISSKAHASMTRDEKTRNKTDDGEPPKFQEYLEIMELVYVETTEAEHSHTLGLFVSMSRAYCGGCVAGASSACRHLSERLWYQFHHWTDERLGIDRPSTLGICGWAPGGKALNSDLRSPIYKCQTVKYERSIADQKKKMERGVKRDCTEGRSADYQIHCSSKKLNPSSEHQFSIDRPCVRDFLRSLRGAESSDSSDDSD